MHVCLSSFFKKISRWTKVLSPRRWKGFFPGSPPVFVYLKQKEKWTPGLSAPLESGEKRKSGDKAGTGKKCGKKCDKSKADRPF